MTNKITEVVVIGRDIETAQATGKVKVICNRLKAAGVLIRYMSFEDFYAEKRSREDVVKELRSITVYDELVVESTSQRVSKADRHTFTPPHKVGRNRIRRGKR